MALLQKGHHIDSTITKGHHIDITITNSIITVAAYQDS